MAGDDYVEVKIPKDFDGKILRTDKNGIRGFAQPGETVSLSRVSLESDPYLRSFAVDSLEKPKDDPYEKASTESLREALKARDLPYSGSKAELILAARKHGVKV